MKDKKPKLHQHKPYKVTNIGASPSGKTVKSVTRTAGPSARAASSTSTSSAPPPHPDGTDDTFQHTSAPTFLTTAAAATPSVQANAGKPSNIAEFESVYDTFLDEYLRLEGRGATEDRATCRTCKAPAPRYRCRSDCMGSWLYCQQCIVRNHQSSPLHWIEEWLEAGMYFRRTSLKALGLVVQLNHPPDGYCKLPRSANSDFTVVHTNGVHNVAVNFCRCERTLEHWQQLMRSAWWPGTISNPQTFSQITALGNLSAYEYYRALEELSDEGSTFTGGKVNKRKVFASVMRQFRHLTMLKRRARGHAEDGIRGTKPGQLALPCPACPHPTKNLPADWALAPASKQHLYYLFIGEDANFRLSNTMASSEAHDPGLGDGWAYFVPRQDYLAHIRMHTSEEDIASCSGFQAVFLANTKRSLGLRTTGVGAVSCTRHNVFRANGVGDLQKGERFSNMTYILAAALQGHAVKHVVFSYDIACIFEVNLPRRVETLPIHLRPAFEGLDITYRVPNFPLPDHEKKCHAPYSFHTTIGGGKTTGESVEQNWSMVNKYAAQTKPMGPGTRQVTLDDGFGGQNYLRINSWGATAPRRLTAGVKDYVGAYVEFEHLQRGLDEHMPGMTQQWIQEEQEWQADRSKPCPYEFRINFVTMKEVELELNKEEALKTGNGTTVLQESTPSVFIKLGMDIQKHQRLLLVEVRACKNATASQELDISKRRTALKKKITRYRTLQRIFMPCLREVLSASDVADLDGDLNATTESVRLFMPSDIPRTDLRTTACVDGLPTVEARLRIPEATENLEDIRRGLRSRTMATRFRKANVVGISAATRSRTLMDRVSRSIQTAVAHYRAAYAAAIRLDPMGGWTKRLRPLRDDDTVTGGVERGEGQRVLSWIWYDTNAEELLDTNMHEALRIEFLKSRARRDRQREEIELLEEEMRRTLQFPTADAKEWDARVSARPVADDAVGDGMQAYAREQAAIIRHRRTMWEEKLRPIRVQAALAMQLKFEQISLPMDDTVLAELERLDDDEGDDDGDDNDL
ncbi:hypothetical protein BD626DRAFT_620006 [Schizophyllum amplum]|uniref:CxC2-like cysteine cluster KDZ transposase-associated domain-containing protein n=1 Tax=Schizophyllum amplum TaxID=97359 RepID=A0A550BUX8_9AGAR|nr:hypothetical protein BD626DRAFT_620006 [Auriculariopsis ampla]